MLLLDGFDTNHVYRQIARPDVKFLFHRSKLQIAGSAYSVGHCCIDESWVLSAFAANSPFTFQLSTFGPIGKTGGV